MYRVAESLCNSEGQVYVLGEYLYNFKGMVIFSSEVDVLSYLLLKKYADLNQLDF